MSAVLSATGLTKRYGGVTALAGAGIALLPGEVHSLVGENGAGKSTLVKMLSGVVRPDQGTLELDGRTVEFRSARDAVAHGITIVAQELSLFPDLTVLENLFPYGAPLHRGLLDRAAMADRARPVLQELGLTCDLRQRVGELDLADQQLVEISRALLLDPKVLILDEPTSALPAAAVDRLAAVLDGLRERGIAILYISHFLEEVMRFSQRISVLRDGKVALEGAPADSVSVPDLVTAMLGEAPPERVRRHVPGPADAPAEAAEEPEPSGPAEEAAVAVELAGVTVPGVLEDVSFSVPRGCVVGLAGLQGAGHLTALEVICGRTRPQSGDVRVGRGGRPRSLRHAALAGVAFVPSDRKRYGLMLERTVWENTAAVSWLGLAFGSPWLNRGRQHERAQEHAGRLRLRGGIHAQAGHLSGGNQQKVVFAKWLDADPQVVVLDDPTRGVDVGARAEMHAIIRKLAGEGRAVLIASTDLAELVDCCDRVLVFQRGRIVDELTGDQITEHQLSLSMNAGFVTAGGPGTD